jgi:hypothetical protein
MKGFQNTVLVIVVAILSSQSIHYVYMKYFYPTTSVLDVQLDQDIKNAKTLDELVVRYRKSKTDVAAYEAQLAPGERGESYRRDIEPYKTNNSLLDAINDWERKDEQYRRLWVQWILGVVVATVGAGLYARRSLWVGTALVFAGIGEMLWWCSPTIELGGAIGEFDRLLNAKIILTAATAIAFAGVWHIWTRSNRNAE